jgi:hypothetical protein
LSGYDLRASRRGRNHPHFDRHQNDLLEDTRRRGGRPLALDIDGDIGNR